MIYDLHHSAMQEMPPFDSTKKPAQNGPAVGVRLTPRWVCEKLFLFSIIQTDRLQDSRQNEVKRLIEMREEIDIRHRQVE